MEGSAEGVLRPPHGLGRVVRYGFVGALATVIHYLVLALLVASGVDPVLATALGATMGALTHYLVSARHVFGRSRSVAGAGTFLGVAAVGVGLNAAVVWIGTVGLGFGLLGVQLVATAVVFLTTYVLNARLTFGERTGARMARPFAAACADDDGALPGWVRVAMISCVLLLGIRLVSLPLYPLCDRTESRYAEIAREMQVSGDLVSPHLHGAPFWGKPPLATWAETAGLALFGETEFAVRFPAWLAVVLTLLVIRQIGILLGGRRLGHVAFVVACTAPLVLVMAGGVMTDPFLVLGTSLALLGIVQVAGMSSAQRLVHGMPVRGVLTIVLGLSVATLAKGPIGLIFGMLPVTGLLLSRAGRRRLARFPLVPVAVGCLLLTAPWFLLAEQRTPGFLEYFFVGEHVRRFLDPQWQGDLYGGVHAKPHGIVWLYFALAILPWLPAAWSTARQRGWRRLRALLFAEPMVGVLLMSVLPPLVLFTVASSLLPTYVYPCIPAASVLIAAGIQSDAGASRTAVVSREKIPVTLAAAGLPLLLVVALLPASFWVHASQRDVLAGVGAREVVYARPLDTLYSADFYSHGTAHGVVGVTDPVWEGVRAHPLEAVVISRKRDLRRVPADVRDRLHLELDLDGHYQRWRVDPLCRCSADAGH